MCSFLLFAVLSVCFTMLVILLFVVKSLHEKLNDLIDANNIFASADKEFKIGANTTATKIFSLIYELEQSFKLRNNLIIDNLEELKRMTLKKDEFNRLFELLKREKVLLDNATGEAAKKAAKEKWGMWEKALGCKDSKEGNE